MAQNIQQNLTKTEQAFLKQGLEQNKKAFACFYLTLKAHKLKPGQNVTHLKSRPIVSCPGSLLHPLGIWTDRKLQSLAKQQDSYFRNSYDLRQDLCSTQYPTTAQLFTADAISMYTNIPTNTAIMLIAKHIRTNIQEERPKQNEALIAALKLVMLNNIFCFGNMTFKQLNGTAMGTPPAPPPPPPPTLRSTMDYMNKNFCPTIGNMRFFTSASLMMSSVSGYHIPMRKSTSDYGTNSPNP